MSEYWVSKKKYFCKYCDTYIADDVPSRQHHESGLRHKGNVERFIRGIYKTGEKRKKDQEEEKREMARVEQAAQAAFAQDVSTGHAKASSAPIASSSSAPRKPAAKPSNPFANYTTAAQLGFTDPDAEMKEIRKSQGVVGDWQLVESTPAPLPVGVQEEDIKPAVDGTTGTEGVGATASSSKRPAEAYPEDDTRIFKLSKKTTTVGLGEIYDPGLITIKPRKREENSSTPDASSSLTTTTPNSEVPKWTAISLKAKDPSTASPSAVSPVLKAEETNGSVAQSTTENSLPVASRWAKVQWGQPIKEEDAAATLSEQLSQAPSVAGSTEKERTVKAEEDAPLTAKAELNTPSLPSEPEQPKAGLFKKRKAPAGAGRGRGRRQS
ncbi:hypothetical protein D9756_007705 [Leucocoprinus leucothites]|uniref:Matrin-type domain-containing protein n=1 Tax=Leucocoprinus leucothites TaxID=201217 RepID=A0A8H5D1D6_9AGAR|nr:hypothetical protein D9756_007705 [Leucoagaricus leucothites]